MMAYSGGGNPDDSVNHVHALCDFAENGVAGVSAAGVVEKIIVLDVNEKLGGGAVGTTGAGHGDSRTQVFQAVGGFVDNRVMGRLGVHIRRHTAALDHKAGDDAVKNRAVVMLLGDVAEKIIHGNRGGGLVQGDGNFALGSFQDYAGGGVVFRA